MTSDQEPPSGFPSSWYVAFYGVDRKRWWDHLSPPGFYHVVAFAYCAHAERWVIYDVTRDRTLIRTYTPAAFMLWLAGLPRGRTIVLFDGVDREARPAHRLGFWCATAVAHLVGVRSRALRPIALYRDLLAQGARPAFTEPHIASAQASGPRSR